MLNWMASECMDAVVVCVVLLVILSKPVRIVAPDSPSNRTQQSKKL